MLIKERRGHKCIYLHKWNTVLMVSLTVEQYKTTGLNNTVMTFWSCHTKNIHAERAYSANVFVVEWFLTTRPVTTGHNMNSIAEFMLRAMALPFNYDSVNNRECLVQLRTYMPEAGNKADDKWLYPPDRMGCIYLSLPLTPASGHKVLN